MLAPAQAGWLRCPCLGAFPSLPDHLFLLHTILLGEVDDGPIYGDGNTGWSYLEVDPSAEVSLVGK